MSVTVTGTKRHLDLNSSTLTTTGNITAGGNILLGDSQYIHLGDNPDLKIYHNGSHSFIQDTGAGDLRLLGSSIKLQNTSEANILTLASDLSATFAGSVTINSNSFSLDGTAPTMTVNSSNNASGFRINVTGLDADGDDLFRAQDSGTTRFTIKRDGDGIFTGDVTVNRSVDTSSPTITIGNDDNKNMKMGVVRSAAGTAPNTSFIAYDGDFRLIPGSGNSTEKFTLNSSGNATFAGTVTATHFYGDGSNLTGITATDSSKLPLAGGTMSGNLFLDDNSGASPYIQFTNGDNNYFKMLNSSSGKLEIYQATTKRADFSSGGLELVNSLTATGLDINGNADISGTTAIGGGTVGSAYSGDVILHTRGGSRSIIQQSSSSDAYYMFGDAGANNAAWVGYEHSNGTLSLQAESAVNINKNTNVSGSVTATSLDINGNGDISGTLTSGAHTINSGADAILTLNQTGTDTGWSYINFNTSGTRNWYIGQDNNKNFDIYNDNTDSLGLSIDYGNNTVSVGTLTWSGGSSTNANTAYGWGNHASAGYLTSHQSISHLAPKASPTFTGDITIPNKIIHSGDTNTYMQFEAADVWRVVTGGTERLDINTNRILVGDGMMMQYDSISTTNSGTVVKGGFLNPASESNMVHIPHVINDLAGFNKWSNATITTSGFYKSRSGSSGSYTYSNEVQANDGGWANAFDAHSSTAGSWYSDNGTDGVYSHGTDTPGVVELEWTNEATYSLWAGIVFGSGSFTPTYVKIEAYRAGAWQTLCEITDNTDQVILRQVSGNSGTNAATRRLKYTLGGSVNNSYFRIHSLYMANYAAGNNNLNNTGTDTTRGVNFLERYKNNYLHGHLYPGADNTYDLGSGSYTWNNVNAVTLNGNLVGTIHSNTTATTQTAGDNTTKVATTAFVGTAVANLVDSAPGDLNTLNELAAALNDDDEFSTTVTTSLGNRVRIDTANQGLDATQKSNARTNIGAQASGNYITGTGSLSAQDLTDIGNLSGTNTGDQDLSGYATTGSIPTNYLTNDAFDTGVGLYLTGGSYNAGTDTATTPLVIDEGDFIKTKDGGYLRSLIGKTTGDEIQIGQSGTSLIDTINFLPGNAGNSAVKINNNTIWNAGNDGAGSGLDADLLDGQHASAFSTATGVANNADVTPSWVPSSDPGYLTSSSTQSKYLRSDTADTATGKIVLEGNSAAWSTTTPGTATGSLHFDPGVGTDHFGNAITFGASDSSNGTTAQAGIYLRTDGGYGSRMYFATTDSYASGSKVAMYINHNKDVYFLDDIDVSGNIAVGGTVDGRNIATDGTKLDTIATNADVTPSWVPSSNPSYLTGITSSQVTTALGYTPMNSSQTTISSAQSQKLAYITVTQAVDLDSTETRANNGHTAYGWGDHGSAGYLTVSESVQVNNNSGLYKGSGNSPTLRFDSNNLISFDTESNEITHLVGKDDEDASTKITADQFMYQTIVCHFSQSGGSTADFLIPMNHNSEATSAQYYHMWAPPHNGRVETMIMKHGHGSAPSLASTTPTRFRIAKNSTSASYSSSYKTRVRVEGRSDDYYSYIRQDSINFGFNAGDRVYFKFQNSSSSTLWRNCSVSIVVRYNLV